MPANQVSHSIERVLTRALGGGGVSTCESQCVFSKYCDTDPQQLHNARLRMNQLQTLMSHAGLLGPEGFLSKSTLLLCAAQSSVQARDEFAHGEIEIRSADGPKSRSNDNATVAVTAPPPLDPRLFRPAPWLTFADFCEVVCRVADELNPLLYMRLDVEDSDEDDRAAEEEEEEEEGEAAEAAEAARKAARERRARARAMRTEEEVQRREQERTEAALRAVSFSRKVAGVVELLLSNLCVWHKVDPYAVDAHQVRGF